MKEFYASKCIQPIRTVKDTFGGAGSNLYMYQERSIHGLWQRTLKKIQSALNYGPNQRTLKKI